MALNQLSGYISDEEEFIGAAHSDGEEVQIVAELKTEVKKSSGGRKGPDFFSFASGNSSDSCTESEEETDDTVSKGNGEIPPDQSSLPKPKFDTQIASSFHSWEGDSSVFKNQYLLAEQAQISTLSRHVQLTESVAFDSQSSKTVCRLFRRGHCRRGDKCKFAHTVPGGVKSNQAAVERITEATASVGAIITAQPVLKGDKEKFFDSNDKPDPFEIQPKSTGPSKKRVGVTNSLIPPKKALAAYDKQKQSERKSSK